MHWIQSITMIYGLILRMELFEQRFDLIMKRYETFRFMVIAIDHPNKGVALKGTAKVIVKIIDQNDNIPQVSEQLIVYSSY